MMTTLATRIQTVALVDKASAPWPNGGGSTRELLAWPPVGTAGREGADDWHWRISVAEVTRPGPFSAFVGVQRGIAVLLGAGIVLQVHGHALRLTPDSEAVHFDGSAPPGCTLVEGPTLDLNLMSRQDAGRGRLQRAQAGQVWTSEAQLRACFSLQASQLIVDDEPALALPPGTLAWSDQAGRQRWRWQPIEPGAHGWWMSFAPARP